MPAYEGPMFGEPLPVELHNTLYVIRGQRFDGLADASGMHAWLTALGDRLPVEASAVEADRLPDLLSLRAAVRDALQAALEGRTTAADAVAELNRASARNPQSLRLSERGSEVHHHAPTAADVVLGVIASRTIELVSGPHAEDLRACGAPGCVLMFLKDHARREWCSGTCGNRARQARHYARTKTKYG